MADLETISPTITGAWDYGGATSLEVPNSATPTVDATGEIALDTDITGHTDLLVYRGSDAAEDKLVIAIPRDQLTTINGHVIAYNATDDEFEMVAQSGGGSSIAFICLQVQSAKIGGSFITNGARIDGGAGAWKLLFATDSTESAIWQFRMPSNYASALVAKLTYSMASATGGNIDIEVEIMAVADGEDIDTTSFDTVNEVAGGTAVPGTAGFSDSISIACTNADSVAAGELVLVRINRDHDDGDDTALGDVELTGLTLEYTTS